MGPTGAVGKTGAVGATGASPMTVTPGQTLTFPPCVLPGPGTQTGSGDANTTFTIAVSGQAYGNGTYITTASSNYFNIYESWKAFGSLSSAYWTSDYLYSVVTGAYAGSMATTIDGTAYIGEWIRITMPTAIWATSISMTGGGGVVPNYTVAALTSAGTWTALCSVTNNSTSTITNAALSGTTSYTTFRVCFNQLSTTTQGRHL